MVCAGARGLRRFHVGASMATEESTSNLLGTEPTLRTIAMPADTNPNGDVFGGWLLSQMDLAGGTVAVRRAQGRVVTISVTSMTFKRPVFVGDEVTCYAELVKVGRTSLTVRIET